MEILADIGGNVLVNVVQDINNASADVAPWSEGASFLAGRGSKGWRMRSNDIK